MVRFAFQDFLADKTDKFSGADLTEICQRAAKLAIRECIEKHAERARLREESGAVDEVDDYDPVPEITAAHFEAAMAEVSTVCAWLCVCAPGLTIMCALVCVQARRSVSDADLLKYSSFAATLQQQRSQLGGGMGAANFRFPRAGPTGAGGPAAAPADEEDLYG